MYSRRGLSSEIDAMRWVKPVALDEVAVSIMIEKSGHEDDGDDDARRNDADDAVCLLAIRRKMLVLDDGDDGENHQARSDKREDGFRGSGCRRQ